MIPERVSEEQWTRSLRRKRVRSLAPLHLNLHHRRQTFRAMADTTTDRASAGAGADRFVLRALAVPDFHKGFMQLLGQLTVAGDVSEAQFAERVQRLGDDHYVAVIEDMEKNQIVATGSVFVEHKFVRNCGKAGHIEDVVVDQSVRGQHLGQRIVEFLTRFAEDKGCYKVILDCTIQNSSFYEKCGYKKKEIQMAVYF
ncbi:hypothetical protein M758_2G042700 [Ceratodon purpureus]|nr:hypothetical protein M758_2G042700 [Ceratodon purpureus]